MPDGNGQLPESILVLRHLPIEGLQVQVPQTPRGLHGLKKKPRGHGGREIESRRRLADLDPSRLKTAQGLVDALRPTLESQQVDYGLGAGFHREHPVTAFQTTDQHEHASLVFACIRFDPAISQRFG